MFCLLIDVEMKKIVYLFFLLATSCMHQPEIIIAPQSQCIEEYLHEEQASLLDTTLKCSCGLFSCEEVTFGGNSFDLLSIKVNPRNMNQIAVVIQNNVEMNINSELWIIDYCLAEKRLIETGVDSYIDWDESGLIFYEVGGFGPLMSYDVSTGEKKIILHSEDNNWPTASPFDNKLLYPTWAGEGSDLLIDGNIIDTLTSNVAGPNAFWLDSVSLLIGNLSPSHDTIHLMKANIYTGERVILASFKKPENILNGLSVAPLINGNYVLGFMFNIYIYDINDKMLKSISKGGYFEYFAGLSITPDRKHFIVTKVEREFLDECNYDSFYSFVMYDADGSNPRTLTVF